MPYVDVVHRAWSIDQPIMGKRIQPHDLDYCACLERRGRQMYQGRSAECAGSFRNKSSNWLHAIVLITYSGQCLSKLGKRMRTKELKALPCISRNVTAIN